MLGANLRVGSTFVKEPLTLISLRACCGSCCFVFLYLKLPHIFGRHQLIAGIFLVVMSNDSSLNVTRSLRFACTLLAQPVSYPYLDSTGDFLGVPNYKILFLSVIELYLIGGQERIRLKLDKPGCNHMYGNCRPTVCI